MCAADTPRAGRTARTWSWGSLSNCGESEGVVEKVLGGGPRKAFEGSPEASGDCGRAGGEWDAPLALWRKGHESDTGAYSRGPTRRDAGPNCVYTRADS